MRYAAPVRTVPLVIASALLAACGSRPPRAEPSLYRGGNAPISRAADAAMIQIGAGGFTRGSTPEERERAYQDYERTAGHDAARRGKWFEREHSWQRGYLEAYAIDLAPVTNAAYAEFVRDTGHAPPTMDAATWKRQGFSQRWDTEVVRYVWPGPEPDPQRADHPVVLVTWEDAAAYCRWRGELVDQPRRLPTSAEFERAARGDRGSIYPWGPNFDPSRLNSAVGGPRDTTPVASYPSGASPYGAVDVAGNVFQWTSSPWSHRRGQMTVKGSAWDDFGGLGRGAAEHGRPPTIRHAIVGFRCAGPAPQRAP